MEFFEILNRGAKEENFEVNEEIYNKFMKYKELIKEWNNKINLTAITEDEQIIRKHFLDSIKIFKFSELKNCKKIIDIGTGAGFPGIPMKIINPEINMVLLDSLNKRVKFLDEVISNLGLKNIRSIHGRAEDYAREDEYRENFDAVVSRAVANMTVLSELCIPYVKIGGYFVALKGPAIEQELKEAQNAISILGGQVQDIIKVELEETDLQHNLVVIKKIKGTPEKYPRKAGMVSKKPLK